MSTNKRDIICYIGVAFIGLVYTPYIYYSVKINSALHENQVKDGYKDLALCEYSDFWIAIVSAIVQQITKPIIKVSLEPLFRIMKRQADDESDKMVQISLDNSLMHM